MSRQVISLLGLLGVSLFIITTITSGMLLSNYSHLSQLISESYAIDTPYGIQLRYFGFLPSGILITAFSFLSIKYVPNSAATKMGLIGIGLFYGLGTVVVSIFPCDSGCNKEMINPTISQFLHNLSGLLTYLFVPICLLILGLEARKWPRGKTLSIVGLLCACISILFIFLIMAATDSNYIGLIQRVIEASILFWIISFSLYLRKLKS